MTVVTVLACSSGIALAETTIYPYHSILTTLQDPTNFPNANTIFRGSLFKSDEDPDLYINSLQFTAGLNWDPAIALTIPSSITYSDSGGSYAEYQFATPIAGLANWYIDTIAAVYGATDPVVQPGVYDFTVDFIGGDSEFASDTVASLPLQLEVFPRIDVSAVGFAVTDPANPGDTVEVSATLTNHMNERNFVTTTWYTYVPGFHGPGDAELDDYIFTGPWFGVSVEPTQSATNPHTTWYTKPGHPGGTYVGNFGIYGGLHDGDYFEVPAATQFILNGGAALPGDANFSAVIDLDDFALVDRGYARGSDKWTGGDFNDDGVVDEADYLIIDQQFALQNGGSLSAAFLADRAARFGGGYVQTLMASVPEPASGFFALTPLALAAVQRRRRPC